MHDVACKPINEEQRLKALSEYRILGSRPEEAYDSITRIASLACNVPIALISLVDRERQWFKSKVGLTVNETSRDISFCAHTILNPDPMVVEDALFDQRFKDNPLVTQEPHIRLYAGFPLETPTEDRLGTLCVIDRIPKSLTNTQFKIMQELANQVVVQLELRKRSFALMEEFCQMHNNQGIISTCSYCRSVKDHEGKWQPFDQFMMQFSTLNFSHGICQSCMNKHFPEINLPENRDHDLR